MIRARIAAALALAAVALAPRVASALELGTAATPSSSPQHFAFELRFGPYYPQVDSEPGLTGKPFENVFGGKSRLLVAAELDWQMLRIPHLGTLGPALGVGYTTMSADAKTLSGQVSGDETFLDVYPMHLSAVLRADMTWRELHVPIVPYAKVGVGYALWRAGNTGGTSEVKDASGQVTSRGRGGTAGTNLALGAAIVLDALDRGAIRNLDGSTGINHVYLFAEYYLLTLNGFGASDALRVGSSTWAAGLTFEF